MTSAKHARAPEVPVEEEARRREEEDAQEEAYEADEGEPAVDEAHADDPVAEELAKETVRDLTEGGHAVGERDGDQSQRNR